jgi:hypothetical protein
LKILLQILLHVIPKASPKALLQTKAAGNIANLALAPSSTTGAKAMHPTFEPEH